MPADFGNALLESTGPAAHLEAVRQRLAAADRSLEESFASEQQLYAAAGLRVDPGRAAPQSAVVAPGARDDRDAWFAELVTLEDLAGMTHCHTTYSDGTATIEAMAHAAEARGFRYLTVTDHSPSASYAGGVTADQLARQWDEIARVQELVPSVVLLKGTESDILVDGALDYPDAILEQLDVVIASIHQRHRLDRATMTLRLVNAMQLPMFKIWGHALGRLVGRRDPIDCDVEQVLDAIAAGRAAVEINADPHRLDLPPEWVARARARRIPLVVSTDAHSIRALDNLHYGVATARRGGVRKHEVLNALPTEAFVRAVRPA